MSEQYRSGRKIAAGAALVLIGLVAGADVIFDHFPKESNYSHAAHDAQVAGHTEAAENARGDSGDQITWIVGEGIGGALLLYVGGSALTGAAKGQKEQ